MVEKNERRVCRKLMNNKEFDRLFSKFTRNTRFTLPVNRQTNEKYENELKNIYKEYMELLREHPYALNSELIESAGILCNNIVKILSSSQEDRNEIMDQILRSFFDKISSDDLLVYRKKGVKGTLAPTCYHSKEKEKDLLYLYRSTNRVDDIINAKSNAVKLEQMFHCPYNLSSKVSSTRYSMKGVPSLYLATSKELSFSELKELEPGSAVYISKFKINREPTESVKQVKVFEFGIVPDDFNKAQKASEEDKDLPINKFRVFKDDLFKEIKVKESYLLWYPLFAACSFIRKNDIETNESQEYPEYIIPQLFLTRLNEKSASTGVVYGIRYFSCADENSYVKGFNYVFPCGETIENINKPKFYFSEKLVDNFKLTSPEKYRVTYNESSLSGKLKELDGISIKDWNQYIVDDALDVDNFVNTLYVHESWHEFIRNNREIIKTVIKQLINDNKTIPTNPMRVFRFFNRDIAEIKVVILGQDPYPQKNTATGRSFEVNNLRKWEDLKRNTSMQNIIKSIYNNSNYGIQTYPQLRKKISEGDFKILPPSRWFDSLENQGVLFINTSLTCKLNKPNSHKKYWQDFSAVLLKEIDTQKSDIRWFVWGKYAEEFYRKFELGGTPHFSMHPRLHGKSMQHIINFDWKGNGEDIEWLGIREDEIIEKIFDKGEYCSVENRKLSSDY